MLRDDRKIEISIHNQYFKVKILDRSLLHIINYVKENLSLYDYVYDKLTNRSTRVLDSVYYVYDKNHDFYRFTNGILKDFILILKEKGIKREDIKIFYFKHYEIAPLGLEMQSGFESRDYQETYIEELVKPDARHALLVDLQTGRGKSFISMKAMCKLNLKTAMLLVPKYIDKWIIDLKKYTNIKDSEYFIVQGSESLYWLIDNPDKKFKFIIFSLRTISNYIKDYEEFGEYYKISPEMLAQHLKIGITISDETHEEFHAVNKTSLYFDTKHFIGLSATLDNNKKDLRRMYYYMFPDESRLDNIVEVKRIAHVVAIMYRVTSSKRLRHMRPKGYSHNEFEKSALKINIFLREYINMINYYLIEGYINRRQPGQKCLLFFDSIIMCEVICNQLRKLYPKLVVSKYTGNRDGSKRDPFSNLMDSDICVSTPLSAGTAVDIPNLITVIQTVSLSSLQRNKQNIGRLREIEGVDVKYYYFFCRDIKRQYEMHLERLTQINKVSKSVNFVTHFKVLPTF